ncbi:unnamed protein product [Agarophyton chilense]|eukprot:gb/GEZJ01002921.1/.p2 GENE.gb/GEZJ01002921.1/~~gb/GEZJ01002921.1/.p2  ORF type:complete len:105 (-),score=22.46 gb/GEZJ01002921.1/:1614-1928(-)
MVVIPETEGVTEINLIATLTIKPEFVKDVKKTFFKLVTESRKEDGNISYEPMQGVEKTNIIVVVETWKSKEDLQLHFDSKHHEDAMKEMDGKMESVELTFFNKL